MTAPVELQVCNVSLASATRLVERCVAGFRGFEGTLLDVKQLRYQNT